MPSQTPLLDALLTLSEGAYPTDLPSFQHLVCLAYESSSVPPHQPQLGLKSIFVRDARLTLRMRPEFRFSASVVIAFKGSPVHAHGSVKDALHHLASLLWDVEGVRSPLELSLPAPESSSSAPPSLASAPLRRVQASASSLPCASPDLFLMRTTLSSQAQELGSLRLLLTQLSDRLTRLEGEVRRQSSAPDPLNEDPIEQEVELEEDACPLALATAVPAFVAPPAPSSASTPSAPLVLEAVAAPAASSGSAPCSAIDIPRARELVARHRTLEAPGGSPAAVPAEAHLTREQLVTHVSAPLSALNDMDQEALLAAYDRLIPAVCPFSPQPPCVLFPCFLLSFLPLTPAHLHHGLRCTCPTLPNSSPPHLSIYLPAVDARWRARCCPLQFGSRVALLHPGLVARRSIRGRRIPSTAPEACHPVFRSSHGSYLR
jgi:hypothetical protein